MKEAKPSFYLRNRSLSYSKIGLSIFSDLGTSWPLIQYHFSCRNCAADAIFTFVNKIQETGALLVKRVHQNLSIRRPIDHSLVGPFAAVSKNGGHQFMPESTHRYLALHLRFETDMAAHSMCYFGCGEGEKEFEAYRAIHFPRLFRLEMENKLQSATALRSEGQCPLTPEEAVLMRAALGFNRKTHVYIAGARIYGGKSRMAALTSLYPNLVTKEILLTTSEIAPFLHFSSQLAALDFIAGTAADAFAIADSGSQLSSLVEGFRMYYGGGWLPTIRPNKRRLAGIFAKNATIEWEELEERVRKAVRESKRVQVRQRRGVYSGIHVV